MKFSKFRILSVVITLLILAFQSPVYGQVQLNEMIEQLETMQEDTSKVNHLNGISQSLLYQHPDSSLLFARRAHALALKLDYKAGVAIALKCIGNVGYVQGDYKTALDNYVASLEYTKELGDSLNLAHLYNNIGNLYDEQSNASEARSYYVRALSIYKEINDFDGQATIFHNLGVQSIAEGTLDSAIYFLDKTLQINLELKDPRLDALAFGNLGYAYLEKAVYDTAQIYFDHSLREFEQLGDMEGIANQYLNHGELEVRKGNHAAALPWLKRSETLLVKHDLKYLLLDDYKLMSQTYESLGDHEQALTYFQLYKDVSDQIFSDEKTAALYSLKAKNEQEIAIAKVQAEREIEAERFQTAQTQNYLLIAITGLALIVMLVSAYYFMNKHRVSIQLQEQNGEILNQKKEIENQRKQVSAINRDLKEKNSKLNKLNKEKNYLMHVVAHDMKSPLNQMAGLVKLINMEPEKLSDQQQNYLEKIETVSTRLGHMVEKILDIEAIERKSSNLNFEAVDLRDILGETITEFEEVAKQKNIDISSNINGKINMVKLDREHAMQVFGNLISNAIKFSPPNKKVEVLLESVDDEVVTQIVDEGPGLNEEDKSKVFKKFQKLSAQPTGNEESNGLGLSIVKKYVEAMNGKVWVESDFGKGANFKVSFQKA